ncbi:MAG: DUF4405 domain-containing protein [Oscillospiraceae bacterium]
MKPKTAVKISADFAMTVLLLLLMTYELIGQEAHEWLGIAIFALFVLHLILNRSWLKSIFRGKYTPVRVLYTVTAAGVLLAMLGSAVSGVILSRYALAFLPIEGGRAFARTLHLLSAYWGFVLISFHLGLNQTMLISAAKRFTPLKAAVWAARFLTAGIAAYGIYTLVNRGLLGYMFLQNRFVFFDHDEPLLLFLADYAAIMGLFAAAGHYLSKLMKFIKRREQS